MGTKNQALSEKLEAGNSISQTAKRAGLREGPENCAFGRPASSIYRDSGSVTPAMLLQKLLTSCNTMQIHKNEVRGNFKWSSDKCSSCLRPHGHTRNYHDEL